MSARRAVVILLAAAAAVVALPCSAALAHNGLAHQAEDSAFHDPAEEPRLESFTRRATASDAATAGATAAAAPQDAGS